MKIAVFWFRRDLRLEDNTALAHALESGFKVLPIFMLDENILENLKKDDARLSFIHSLLENIQHKLRTYGTSLKVLHGNPLELWKEIIKDYEIEAVYTNKDYEPYAIKRDAEIENFLSEKGIPFHSYKDQVIFEENEIVKKDSKPYTIFTPYKNQWLQKFKELKFSFSKTDFSAFYSCDYNFPSLESIGFVASKIQVKNYDLSVVEDYAKKRDFPSMEAGSDLGAHLRFGSVSIRKIVSLVSQKEQTFLSELIWREFFMQILYHFPKVIDANFKRKYDGVKWRNKEEEFLKWCEGKTGYPLVDAGMRELNQTGRMHNRVRMVVASFLCKHLLIDWKWGEAYFAEKLLDYELSSNNGNWQWAASTGCDAVPYFRIFNPSEQIKKFDKHLVYVRKWVEEFDSLAYPTPMVEHKFARERALKAYKEGIL